MHISKHRTHMFLILQKLSRILRSLGFGLGRETFANFWRVSVLVSENFSENSLGFGLENLVSEKVLVSVPENLVLKKVSVSVSENLVSKKKSHFWFRKMWYRKKSLGIGFLQEFGIVIQ